MNKDSNIDEQLEKQIAEYLLEHPDYLLRHPGVLVQLELQQNSGAAVSFMEHKIRILQKQSTQYRQQLEELVSVARDNEDLHHRMHRLTLTLIKARSQSDVYEILEQELTGHFKADAIALKLFTAPQLEAHAGESTRAMFDDFMQTDQPSCGELAGEKLHNLFDTQLGESGSAALIPIRTSNLAGVLAVGSKDRKRFPPGKGVDFLVRLGELVSLTLHAVGTK